MSVQRIIQCIGISEEDMAHLRLLLRVVRAHVRDSWIWGPESRADLIIVDKRRLIGDSAMRRAAQRGVACAQIIDAREAKPAGLSLRKPFRREALVSLLNTVTRGDGVVSEIDSWADDFSTFDFGQIDLSALEADHPGVVTLGSAGNDAEGPWAVAVPIPGGALSPDPSALPPIEKKPEASAGPASGNAQAGTAVVVLPGNSQDQQARTRDNGSPAPVETVEPDIDKDAAFPLIRYLEKGLLTGPARISLRGLPPLLLDPEDHLFWAKGLLPALEPYARQPLRFGDWQRMTRVELGKARMGMAARPFQRLIWMYSLIQSKGFLAKHLDPSGNFQLNNRIDFSLDYPRAVRVGALMTMPRRLHEIARVSGVGLAEIFDIINAYDSIGYVEWTPRESGSR